ncbi:MAG TPA: response regulator [Methanoregula sp.]|nr:response regulator [Methanoregula sp.]
MIRLLYVDDNTDTCAIINAFCERMGTFTVQILSSGQAALEWLSRFSADVIVSDYALSGSIDGITFLKTLRSEGNRTPFILFTSDNSRKIKEEACRQGAFCVIPKASLGKNTIYLLIRTFDWAVKSGDFRNPEKTAPKS